MRRTRREPRPPPDDNAPRARDATEDLHRAQEQAASESAHGSIAGISPRVSCGGVPQSPDTKRPRGGIPPVDRT